MLLFFWSTSALWSIYYPTLEHFEVIEGSFQLKPSSKSLEKEQLLRASPSLGVYAQLKKRIHTNLFQGWCVMPYFHCNVQENKWHSFLCFYSMSYQVVCCQVQKQGIWGKGFKFEHYCGNIGIPTNRAADQCISISIKLDSTFTVSHLRAISKENISH